MKISNLSTFIYYLLDNFTPNEQTQKLTRSLLYEILKASQ